MTSRYVDTYVTTAVQNNPGTCGSRRVPFLMCANCGSRRFPNHNAVAAAPHAAATALSPPRGRSSPVGEPDSSRLRFMHGRGPDTYQMPSYFNNHLTPTPLLPGSALPAPNAGFATSKIAKPYVDTYAK